MQGLQEKSFAITQSDLKKLPAVTKACSATRANGEKISVDATGPLLNTFMRQFGNKQKDFSRIHFTSKDKYSVDIPHNILANRPIILAYIINGKPLPNDWQPLRIVIPGVLARYWAKGVIFMDCERDK
ncbi:hypothetical protein Dtox_3454 [Desulfofarcimen acetoxidans DSM 771]|uniref:Oxidoreductase molybdopterin-binding domain-containing protein n=1 Tax=Desulfofarcimen acetoxidans (strain ATCC 49208 / DSM 771 / KCTC 5769 / VKM B-1644 / 5575) TaxID=485916 RepID=C8W6R8_DESAS|nr:molybdopterin-dependent oxidoreductase [Desulfofarcimen acetoxidans]ACV64177.1 hypothetical protein Dtox_3454 [Desulfofarcimen acetoxidans DSM 771]